MICPHCSTAAKFNWSHTEPREINSKTEEASEILYCECPNCSKLVIFLQKGKLENEGYEHFLGEVTTEILLYPKNNNILSCDYIPNDYYQDYEEAIKVISASPKASAALTRRLLQKILREKFKIQKKDLAKEIEAFIDLDNIPSHISEAVEAVRIIGNIAAHPTKNLNTGEIVPVEVGEAEWLIEVIEALFDFVFIQPIKLEQRKEELNKKLTSIGKPLMK